MVRFADPRSGGFRSAPAGRRRLRGAQRVHGADHLRIGDRRPDPAGEVAAEIGTAARRTARVGQEGMQNPQREFIQLVQAGFIETVMLPIDVVAVKHRTTERQRRIGDDRDLLAAAWRWLSTNSTWLSEASSSTAKAIPSVMATTGSVTPRRWAAMRSRKPSAERIAEATKSACVPGKYR